MTYRRAERLDPAPTDTVLQANWDEIHALPKTPMKIEFDPKKGR